MGGGEGIEQLWKSWTLLTESCNCGCFWHISAIVTASQAWRANNNHHALLESSGLARDSTWKAGTSL